MPENYGADLKSDMPEEGMEHEGGKVIHVPKSMLPEGCKPGDTYTVRAGEVDEDGDVPLTIEGHGGEKGESWEDQFRRDMSPRSEGKEAY